VWAVRRSLVAATALREWLESGRAPTAVERHDVLRLPARFTLIVAPIWALGGVIFAAIGLDYSVQYAAEVLTTSALASLTVCAGIYLVSERILRPYVGRALGSAAPPEAGSLGIGPRILLTWVLCSGIPFVMLALVPVGRLPDEPQDLIAPIWFIVAIALVGGLLAMKLAVQAVTLPVREVRRGMDAVTSGDLDAELDVSDGSEVGRLQAGFNAMVEGLRERERMRDLFGRQVGPEVARVALEQGVKLGGEARPVAVLFVDVVGSTALASQEEPERVVALLNRFFSAVVEVVEAHGGAVDKFEGDAALCVWGAPVEQPDHAARALACARELRARLDGAPDALDAGIGVSCGTAVVGNVGSEARFEYTVIGDPVNEASRLTELAKTRSPRLLASGATVRTAGEPEAGFWRVDGEAVLRGRGEPTQLAVPREDAVAPATPAVAVASPR
jgi:adenylate cyclase